MNPYSTSLVRSLKRPKSNDTYNELSVPCKKFTTSVKHLSNSIEKITTLLDQRRSSLRQNQSRTSKSPRNSKETVLQPYFNHQGISEQSNQYRNNLEPGPPGSSHLYKGRNVISTQRYAINDCMYTSKHDINAMQSQPCTDIVHSMFKITEGDQSLTFQHDDHIQILPYQNNRYDCSTPLQYTDTNLQNHSDQNADENVQAQKSQHSKFDFQVISQQYDEDIQIISPQDEGVEIQVQPPQCSNATIQVQPPQYTGTNIQVQSPQHREVEVKVQPPQYKETDVQLQPPQCRETDVQLQPPQCRETDVQLQPTQCREPEVKLQPLKRKETNFKVLSPRGNKVDVQLQPLPSNKVGVQVQPLQCKEADAQLKPPQCIEVDVQLQSPQDNEANAQFQSTQGNEVGVQLQAPQCNEVDVQGKPPQCRMIDIQRSPPESEDFDIQVLTPPNYEVKSQKIALENEANHFIKPLRIQGNVVSMPLQDEVNIVDSRIQNDVNIVNSPIQNKVKIVDSPIQNEVNVVDSPIQNEVNIADRQIQKEVNFVVSPIQNEVNVVDSPIQYEVNIADRPIQNEVNFVDSPIQNEVNISGIPIQNEVNVVTRLLQNKAKTVPKPLQNEVNFDTRSLQNKEDIIAKSLPNESIVVTGTLRNGENTVTETLQNEVNVVDNPLQYEADSDAWLLQKERTTDSKHHKVDCATIPQLKHIYQFQSFLEPFPLQNDKTPVSFLPTQHNQSHSKVLSLKNMNTDHEQLFQNYKSSRLDIRRKPRRPRKKKEVSFKQNKYVTRAKYGQSTRLTDQGLRKTCSMEIINGQCQKGLAEKYNSFDCYKASQRQGQEFRSGSIAPAVTSQCKNTTRIASFKKANTFDKASIELSRLCKDCDKSKFQADLLSWRRVNCIHVNLKQRVQLLNRQCCVSTMIKTRIMKNSKVDHQAMHRPPESKFSLLRALQWSSKKAKLLQSSESEQ